MLKKQKENKQKKNTNFLKVVESREEPRNQKCVSEAYTKDEDPDQPAKPDNLIKDLVERRTIL